MADSTATPSARHSRNRTALIEAARRNLVRDGVAGLRFERIAQTADMTRKSVYNHFESRVGLIEALMDDIGERANFARMAPVWDTADLPETLLVGYFDNLTQSWEADRLMFRLMVGLSAADPELGAAVTARIGRVRGVSDRLVSILIEGPGLMDSWSKEDAQAAMFALSSFTTYDAMNLPQLVAAQRLAAMAASPFELGG